MMTKIKIAKKRATKMTKTMKKPQAKLKKFKRLRKVKSQQMTFHRARESGFTTLRVAESKQILWA